MADVPVYKKSVRIIIGTLLVYAVLVASHLGEFWPFSIYPMFSQAGHPWKRAIVRELPNKQDPALWQTAALGDLPGETVPLNYLNVNTNDIANYLSKTEVWNERKVGGIRKMFSKKLDTDAGTLMLFQARGSLTGSDSVQVYYVPYIYLEADTSLLNPQLKTQ